MQYRLVLPEATAEALRHLDRTSRVELDAFMANLADAGWTYQSIADAIPSMNRQRVHYYASRAPEAAERPSNLPEVPPVPEPPQKPSQAVLEPGTAQRLRELQGLAIQLRGHHPADDPRRQASEQLSKLLDAENRRGVTYKDLGEVLGVRPMTVRARLQRHGYRSDSTKLRKYSGAIKEV